MDRREFLKSAATATAAIPFGAFISRVEWMTCEETNDFTTVPHGYVFDVPSTEWATRRQFATWAGSRTRRSPSTW